MKTIVSAVLVSFLFLSGWALASQSGEQKGMSSMMEEMMKGKNEGEHMGGMARMMKMMDQCAAMMEPIQAKSEKTEENQQK